ncbi:MAG: biopolymer transporter ExbD [Pseudomonadota bacterium]
MKGTRGYGQRREPTIALINVVFLMLVFFLIAGTIAPPVDSSIELVDTVQLDGAQPADALVIFPDGRVTFQGAEVDPASFSSPVSMAESVRLLPDRELPAVRLLEVADMLRLGGADKIVVVTEKGLR